MDILGSQDPRLIGWIFGQTEALCCFYFTRWLEPLRLHKTKYFYKTCWSVKTFSQRNEWLFIYIVPKHSTSKVRDGETCTIRYQMPGTNILGIGWQWARCSRCTYPLMWPQICIPTGLQNAFIMAFNNSLIISKVKLDKLLAQARVAYSCSMLCLGYVRPALVTVSAEVRVVLHVNRITNFCITGNYWCLKFGFQNTWVGSYFSFPKKSLLYSVQSLFLSLKFLPCAFSTCSQEAPLMEYNLRTTVCHNYFKLFLSLYPVDAPLLFHTWPENFTVRVIPLV